MGSKKIKSWTLIEQPIRICAWRTVYFHNRNQYFSSPTIKEINTKSFDWYTFYCQDTRILSTQTDGRSNLSVTLHLCHHVMKFLSQWSIRFSLHQMPGTVYGLKKPRKTPYSPVHLHAQSSPHKAHQFADSLQTPWSKLGDSTVTQAQRHLITVKRHDCGMLFSTSTQKLQHPPQAASSPKLGLLQSFGVSPVRALVPLKQCKAIFSTTFDRIFVFQMKEEQIQFPWTL